MAERPILFSAPMIRALLAGRKTMTRRVLKPQPFTNGIRYDAAFGDIICHCDELPPSTLMMRKGRGKNAYTASILEDGPEGMSGFFVGDRLWVRETWKPHSVYADLPPREIPKSKAFYRADDQYAPSNTGWVPSIHMPRWASRLTLEVTGVKLERLQEISEEDARAEGLRCLSKDGGRVWKWGLPERDGWPGRDGWEWQMWCIGHQPAFAKLWDSINGPEAWSKNQWCAAISFTVHHANIDALPRKKAAELSPATL